MKLTKLAKTLSVNLIIATLVVIGVVIATSAVGNDVAHAVDICSTDVAEDIKAASGCGGSTPELRSVVLDIVNTVIGVTGVVAVVFVVVGGVKYMTSNGDTGKVEIAKRTVLFSCIGLIICALAFAIVNFVIRNIIK